MNKVKIIPYDLTLKRPFGVAGNTRSRTDILLIEISQDGETGFGEASFPPYLKYRRDDCLSELGELHIPAITSLIQLQEFIDLMNDKISPPALAAIDIAMHDLLGKLLQKSVAQLYGMNPELPLNCYTIGISEIAQIKEKVAEAEEFELLKIKLDGSTDDITINEIRKHTDKPLAIDLNQGWKECLQGKTFIENYSASNIAFIEQPFPVHMRKETAKLKAASSIPLIADESFQSIEDLETIPDTFHGINIKLMKCGGIYNATEIIKEARKKGMKILMGSMNESSCANIAAAHIAGACDWTDLDGPFLISNNPFENPIIKKGRIVLSNEPGLGIKKL